MTRPQKLKSLLYFICFIVTAIIYAKTINQKQSSEKSKQDVQQKVVIKSEKSSSHTSTTNYLDY